MPDVTAAELRAAIRQLGNVMVRTDDGDASGVIIHTEMVAGHLAGLIGNREERGPCRHCSHREREHREICSRDGGCDACECRSYLPPRDAPPAAAPVPAFTADPELHAMSVIARELTGLGDPDAVARVIRYLADRYGSDED